MEPKSLYIVYYVEQDDKFPFHVIEIPGDHTMGVRYAKFTDAKDAREYVEWKNQQR